MNVAIAIGMMLASARPSHQSNQPGLYPPLHRLVWTSRQQAAIGLTAEQSEDIRQIDASFLATCAELVDATRKTEIKSGELKRRYQAAKERAEWQLRGLLSTVQSAALGEMYKAAPPVSSHSLLYMRCPIGQVELRLSKEQRDRVEEIYSEYVDELRRPLSVDSSRRNGRFAAAIRKRIDADIRFHSKARGLLTPAQRLRVNQVELQFDCSVGGVQVFLRPRGADNFKDARVRRPLIAEELKLTRLQRRTIGRIEAEYLQGERDLGKKGRFSDLGRMRVNSLKRAIDVLNSVQKQQWKEMVGAPFVLYEHLLPTVH